MGVAKNDDEILKQKTERKGKNQNLKMKNCKIYINGGTQKL